MPPIRKSSGGLTAPVDATNIADGSVSDAEFQYLNGVTSSIQSQIDGKANSSHTHTESDITDLDKYTQAETDNLLGNKVDKDGAKVLSDNNYTTTEKNKLAGIASGAQVNTVTSVASKTGAVDLVKGDVGLGNVDNTSDANKPVSTAQQTALDGKANTSHNHTESDIIDLDKYTQSEVDALIVNKAEIYTMRVSADIVLDDYNDWSAYGGDLVLPVGTYAYKGKLLVSSLDYGNLGIKVQVVRTSGGTITVDGMYELKGGDATETGGLSILRTKLIDNGSSVVDIDEQFPTQSVLYGWVSVSGEITVTSSPATLQMRVGRMNTDTPAATIYKGSNINFIKL